MSVTPLLDAVWAPSPHLPTPQWLPPGDTTQEGRGVGKTSSVTVAADELAQRSRRKVAQGRAALWLAELAQIPRGHILGFFCHYGQRASHGTIGKRLGGNGLGSAHGHQRREAGGA